MTTITSNGTGGGDALTGSTWAGGVAPGIGDTAIVAVTDTVTLAGAMTIGLSSATTSVMALTCTGTFRINSGGTLNCRGSVDGAGTLWVDTNGIFKFDSTAAAAPTTTRYYVQMAAAGTVKARGIAGARATITSDTTGGAAQGIFNTNAYTTDFQYLNVTNTGAASVANNLNGHMYWDHVTWDSHGYLAINTPAAKDIVWSYVTLKNSYQTSGNGISAFFTTTLATTGLRSISNLIVVDRSLFYRGNPTGLVVDGQYTGTNVTLIEYCDTTISDGTMTVRNHFSTKGGQNRPNGGVTVENTYIHQATGANSHGWYGADRTNNPMTITNGVLDTDATGSDGDFFVPLNQTVAGKLQTVTMRNIIVTPNDGTGASGSLLNLAFSIVGYSFVVEHCSARFANIANQGNVVFMEGNVRSAIGGPNKLTVRDTLFWGVSEAKITTALHCETGFLGAARHLIDSSANGTLPVSAATATSMTAAGKSWLTTGSAPTLWTSEPGAHVRIITAARQQVVPITGQSAADTLTVAAWTNGTPQVGDTWEIFMPDIGTATTLNYNGHYRGGSGTIYRPDAAQTTVTSVYGYGDMFITTGTPGANDVLLTDTGNETTDGPLLMGSTRDLKTWATTKGLTATRAAVLAELQLCNDDSGRTLTGTLSENITDLVRYVSRGYIPRALSLRGAGHDGSSIGPGFLPTLSALSCTNAGVCSVTPNIADGTFYWVDTTSSTAPTYAQVLAGLNNAGTAAVASGNQANAGASANTITSTTNLTNGVAYYRHVVLKAASVDASLADHQKTSEPIAGGASFTYAAGGTNNSSHSAIAIRLGVAA